MAYKWKTGMAHRIKFNLLDDEIYLEPGDFLILEGGPGSGKTYLLDEIYNNYSNMVAYAWPDRENRRQQHQMEFYQRPRAAISKHILLQITKALIEPAEIYLLDEPDGNLELVHQIELFNSLRELAMKWEKIVVVATHSHTTALWGTRRIKIDYSGKTWEELGPGEMNK